MTGILTALAFISAVLFPWPLTAVLALAAGTREPLVPLAVGLFMDALYSTLYSVPWATVCGALLCAALFFVRSRLRTSSMG